MFQLHTNDATKLCDGLSRREMMRVGGLGLGGLSLASLIKNREAGAKQGSGDHGAGFGKAKNVIIFGLVGGIPQHETWDPKPNGPQETRGIFGTTATATPGYHVGELMPKTAKHTEKLAVLRGMFTGDNAHSTSGYQMLTGVPHQPLNRESARAKAPNLFPSMGAMVRALKYRGESMPSAVTIPEHIWNDGNIDWPGQDAGFLGRQYDPWLVKCYPNEGRFDMPGMSLPEDISTVRLHERRSLLDQINGKAEDLSRLSSVTSYGEHTQQAYNLLGATAAGKAFDLSQESDALRDRYGRERLNQSCLRARRLVESGVSLVQINWTRIKKEGLENQGGWDTHAKHNVSLKDHLMPLMDMAFSTLIEDLDDRGMLDETLVVMFTEFGHTPKFNAREGRDHWGSAFSIALAGGGVKGGAVLGKTDQNAAYVTDGMTTAADFVATVFHLLGYPPHTELYDPFGRPTPISRGRVITEILA